MKEGELQRAMDPGNIEGQSAEIARLRADNDAPMESCAASNSAEMLIEAQRLAIDRLRAKVERLTAALSWIRDLAPDVTTVDALQSHARAALAADDTGIKNLTTQLGECDADCATQVWGLACTCGARKFRKKFGPRS